jgi:hypothetical protein
MAGKQQAFRDSVEGVEWTLSVTFSRFALSRLRGLLPEKY